MKVDVSLTLDRFWHFYFDTPPQHHDGGGDIKDSCQCCQMVDSKLNEMLFEHEIGDLIDFPLDDGPLWSLSPSPSQNVPPIQVYNDKNCKNAPSRSNLIEDSMVALHHVLPTQHIAERLQFQHRQRQLPVGRSTTRPNQRHQQQQRRRVLSSKKNRRNNSNKASRSSSTMLGNLPTVYPSLSKRSKKNKRRQRRNRQPRKQNQPRRRLKIAELDDSQVEVLIPEQSTEDRSAFDVFLSPAASTSSSSSDGSPSLLTLGRPSSARLRSRAKFADDDDDDDEESDKENTADGEMASNSLPRDKTLVTNNSDNCRMS